MFKSNGYNKSFDDFIKEIENLKENQTPINPEELNDETLNNISGGINMPTKNYYQ